MPSSSHVPPSCFLRCRSLLHLPQLSLRSHVSQAVFAILVLIDFLVDHRPSSAGPSPVPFNTPHTIPFKIPHMLTLGLTFAFQFTSLYTATAATTTTH